MSLSNSNESSPVARTSAGGNDSQTEGLPPVRVSPPVTDLVSAHDLLAAVLPRRADRFVTVEEARKLHGKGILGGVTNSMYDLVFALYRAYRRDGEQNFIIPARVQECLGAIDSLAQEGGLCLTAPRRFLGTRMIPLSDPKALEVSDGLLVTRRGDFTTAHSAFLRVARLGEFLRDFFRELHARGIVQSEPHGIRSLVRHLLEAQTPSPYPNPPQKLGPSSAVAN